MSPTETKTLLSQETIFVKTGPTTKRRPSKFQSELTFDKQVKSIRVLLQDLDGNLHHLRQRGIRLRVPLQVVHQIRRFKETWDNGRK